MPTTTMPEKKTASPSSMMTIQEKLNKNSSLRKSSLYFLSSISTGAITTGLFNPIDRALYLAVITRRPFLSSANFVSPYQSAWQAMVMKCAFGSNYYIIQNEMETHLRPLMREQMHAHDASINVSIGSIAGTISAMISNPVSAIKYQAWAGDNRKYLETACNMWRGNKFKSFYKGMTPTIYRDVFFGSFYEVLRHALHQLIPADTNTHKQSMNQTSFNFSCNLISGILATLASSPFNYARNMQFKVHPTEVAPSTSEILQTLYKEAKTAKNTFIGRAGFFAHEFQLGWATARSGIGMAVGQGLFSSIKTSIDQRLPGGASTSNKI